MSSASTGSAASDDLSTLPFPRLSARTMRFTLGIPTSMTVAPDGSTVLFVRSRSATERAGLLWRFDVASGEESLLADPHDLLAGDDESLPAAEMARRERMRQGGAGITAFSTDEAVQRVALALSGRVFVVDVATGACSEVPVSGAAVDPRLSPDGRWVAYHSEGALHVAPASGEETGHALAGPEPGPVSWGLSDFVHAEELDRLRSFWWSPDSTALLVTRVDESPVAVVHIADPAHPDQAPTPVRYPFAGSANPTTSLWYVTVDGVREQVLADNDGFEYLVDVHWSGDEPALVSLLDRAQQVMQVMTWLPGQPLQRRRRISDDAWVDVVPGVPAWWGQRLLTVENDESTDTMRLLADATPISPPGVGVRSVQSVTDDMVLMVVGEDDQEARVASLDAEHRWRLLTPGGQTATGRARGGTIVIREDTLDSTMPTVTVSSAEGSARLRLDAVAPPLHPRPTLLRRDTDTDPRVAVLLPTEHDGAPLPVLLDPYGGPHGQRTVASARAYLESQWFADQGFVVVVADGPGTPGAPSWQRAMAGDITGPALAAQVRALQMVGDQLGEVADLTRVAIRGWSFGGSLAALAVMERPDLVHAAVSGAPVTDFALYDTAYTERYLGTPQQHPQRYASQSLLTRASRLERPLMIIHGLADDNVLVANSLRLSSALLAAGKQHHVLPLTGVTHMAGQEDVAENLMLAQLGFVRQALGLGGPNDGSSASSATVPRATPRSGSRG